MRIARKHLLCGLLVTSLAAFCAGGWTIAHAQEPQGSLEQRVSRLERLVESQGLVDLFLQLEKLQQEVQALRGELEEQGHKLEGLRQRQRELYLDIDRRLRQVELEAQGASRERPTPSQPASPAPPAPQDNDAAPGPPAGVSPPDPESERKAYREAFNLLKEGRYEAAIGRLERFLASYPNSSYADNSQYWLGEAYYVTRQFEEAVREFRKVVDKYPDSPKHADALLKVGYCYYELQDFAQARETLSRVQSQYPQTTAARLAENRLQRMKLEGR